MVGIFPDRGAILRLVGAALMEQTDVWAEQRRYMGPEALAKARAEQPADDTQEVTKTPMAISA